VSDRLLRDERAGLPISSRKTVYSGRVWDVRQEVFDYVDGSLTRDYVAHTGAVAVLVMDEDDNILTIQQYRHPLRLREWEIPAGLLDIPGESAWECAKRELAEEVDLVAQTWHVLADYATSPGGSDEIIRVFLARDIRPTDTPHAREGEELDMVTRWVPLQDAVDSVLAGLVGNSVFTVAILTADAAKKRGWSTLRPADAAWDQREWRDLREGPSEAE
jgi:8-oxo-dGTP pyrophosphatase MutT (NUDIX family)